MLSLKDIREYVDSLGIAENVYIGKMDNKKPKSIGVYNRPASGPPRTTLGGPEYGTYRIKPVSLLIHWNKNKDEAEKAAFSLFEQMEGISGININNTDVRYIQLQVPEPQDVGTDDAGIYEYVIWLDFIYNKEK